MKTWTTTWFVAYVDCDPVHGYPLRYPSGFTCSAENTCRLA
jgi:hypothetical protein